MIAIFLLLLIAMFIVVRFCKKTIKLILSTLILLAAAYSVIVSIDINRVEHFQTPIFIIGSYEESDLIEYQGLGYKTVVKYSYTDNNEQVINSIEMYMFDRCIAAAIQ